MNERIRELAEQSGYGARWTTTEQFEQFMEKFAESIVKECANHIMASSDRYRKQYFADKILKYFGVEE